MNWRQRVGIPVHPLLVHFPIAFWFSSPLLDLAALFAGEPYSRFAVIATVSGVVAGAGAIVTGLMEYSQPSLAGIDMRLAAKHGTRTSIAWCVFTCRSLAALLVPPASGWNFAYFLLDVAGCVVLAHGVYLGTKQVYEQLYKN